MSCRKCELEPLETYVRVDNAEVMIAGCQEHLRLLLECYKEGRKHLRGLSDAVDKQVVDRIWDKKDDSKADTAEA